MKKSKTVFKIISVLFAACIFISSCSPSGSSDNNSGENTTVSTAAEESSATAAEKLQPDLPKDINFNGETFTFLVTGPGYGYGYYETVDIYSEEQNGETLNDAVYLRNRNVENKLSINIAEYKSDNVESDAKKTIEAGDSSYDAVFTTMFESAHLAQSGLLMNIKDVPNINLDKPWWDKNAENELSILNKLYFTTGDISTMVKACTRLLIFNKKLMKEYDIGDPYEYVKNGSWTFDVYASMVKSIYSDVNGNGEKDDEDIYGTILQDADAYLVITGFGERLTTNNSEGYPEVTFDSVRTFDAADKLWDLYFDDSVCRNINSMKKSDNFSNVFTYARSLFAQDKFLFHLGVPLILSEFRDMESEFGLLPSPKFDASQTRYYHSVDPWATMVCIPVTSDLEKTGAVIESMAAESMYTITPAYNETLLKRKYVRDEESEFVLDIVNQTRTYDLCRFFGWGGLDGLMEDLTSKKSRSLAAQIEKIYEKTVKAIEKSVGQFEEHN